MRTLLALSLLTATLLSTEPLAAQTAAVAPAPATAWSAKPVGKYDLVADVNGEAHPALLTISDSAGTLHALIEPEGQEAHVMTITISGTDLVLKTETPNGTMLITLQRRGDELTGRWERGEGAGEIKGKVHS